MWDEEEENCVRDRIIEMLCPLQRVEPEGFTQRRSSTDRKEERANRLYICLQRKI